MRLVTIYPSFVKRQRDPHPQTKRPTDKETHTHRQRDPPTKRPTDKETHTHRQRDTHKDKEVMKLLIFMGVKESQNISIAGRGICFKLYQYQ